MAQQHIEKGDFGQPKQPSFPQDSRFREVTRFHGSFLANISQRVRDLQASEDYNHPPKDFPDRDAINLRTAYHRDYLLTSITIPGETPDEVSFGLTALNQVAVLKAKPEDVKSFVVKRNTKGEVVYDVDWYNKPESLTRPVKPAESVETRRSRFMISRPRRSRQITEEDLKRAQLVTERLRESGAYDELDRRMEEAGRRFNEYSRRQREESAQSEEE